MGTCAFCLVELQAGMGGRLGNGLALRGPVVVDKTLEECGKGRVELVG